MCRWDGGCIYRRVGPNDAQRRREAGIPEGIAFRKKWELALEIIDQIREWGLADRVVLGDAGYGDGTEFREELEKRELKYALGVLQNCPTQDDTETDFHSTAR